MAKRPGGRPPLFKTAAEIDKAIRYYFDSITKTEPAFNTVLKGYEDEEKKKPIYEQVPVLNNAGEQIGRTTYFEHPSIVAMCRHMGITRETLLQYEAKPEFSDTIKRAKARVEEYLESELLRKDQVTGIIFNLKNNFGWKDKQEIDVGNKDDKPFEVNIKVVD